MSKKLFIVTYDIPDAESKDYVEMYKLLNELNAIRIQKSVYMFKSNKNSEELMELFKTFCIKDDDRIFITESTDWSSYNSLNRLKSVID